MSDRWYKGYDQTLLAEETNAEKKTFKLHKLPYNIIEVQFKVISFLSYEDFLLKLSV